MERENFLKFFEKGAERKNKDRTEGISLFCKARPAIAVGVELRGSHMIQFTFRSCSVTSIKILKVF